MPANDHWETLQQLFREALTKSPADRRAFLDAATQHDSTLKQKVLDLIKAHSASETIATYEDCQRSSSRHSRQTTTLQSSTPLQQIGPYKIIQEIGRGGMGVVYEATQERPQRRVALKVIQASRMTPALRRRFEHEAQLLGRLQHPGIAQIYEAGTAITPLGEQPYFAMEFIDGQTLSQFVEREQPPTEIRLQLLAQICDAIEHAHQKGVIHRDLKPGNILIQHASGNDLQPKILDLGVARATDSDLHTVTLQTDIGQLLGTVPYMSPEQASGNRDQLDTRSDIYALGIVGYELLAGELPYDIKRKMIHEAVRVIQDEEPSRLSSISKTYRGDIETIIAKALEKDRERRYQSAGDMAADIRRYLNHEPITARPASRLYQLQKFAKRNKAIVGSVAAILCITTAAAIVATVLAVQKSGALEDANTANALASERLEALEQSQTELQSALKTVTQEKENAERQQRIANAVREFLEDDVIAQADPTVNQNRDLTMREALDNAAARIDTQFADTPEIEHSIQSTLGMSYLSLGELDAATTHLDRAVTLAKTVYGKDSIQSLIAQRDIAELTIKKRDFQSAIDQLQPLHQSLEARLGPHHEETLITQRQLGWALLQVGSFNLAQPLFEDAVAKVESGETTLPDRRRWNLLANYATLLKSQGSFDAAEPILRDVLDEMSQTLGDNHPDTFTTGYNLAILLMEASRLNEGTQLITNLIQRSEQVLGETDSRTLAMRTVLAGFLQRQGKLHEALQQHTDVYSIQKQTLGNTHLETITSRGQIAAIHNRLGEYDKALPILRDVVAQRIEMFGQQSAQTILAQTNLASTLAATQQFDEAEQLYHTIIKHGTQLFGRSSTRTLAAIHNLASLYEQKKEFDKAIPLYQESVAGHRAIHGSNHPNALIPIGNLAGIYLIIDPPHPDKALPLIEEALSGFREALGEDHWIFAATLQKQGKCLMLLDRHDEAIAPLEQAIEIFKTTLGDTHERTLATQQLLDELHQK